jgi:hypothetical protein
MIIVALGEVDNAAKSAPQRPTSKRTSMFATETYEHTFPYKQLSMMPDPAITSHVWCCWGSRARLVAGPPEMQYWCTSRHLHTVYQLSPLAGRRLPTGELRMRWDHELWRSVERLHG